MNKIDLINSVLEQLVQDVENSDLTALEELLNTVDEYALLGYLFTDVRNQL